MLTTQGSESHQVYCLPEDKPDDCDQASFDELAQVFDGPSCPAEQRSSRQIRAGPPAYLSVPQFRKCLGEHTLPGATHTELCLLPSKPADCPAESWDRIGKVFVGDKCLQNQQTRKARARAPAYLSVPNFQACLGVLQRPGESHTEWCLPAQKKPDCPDSSWQTLVKVFEGDKCAQEQRKSRVLVPMLQNLLFAFVSDVVVTRLESLGLTFSQVCLIFASKSGALFYPILPYFTCNHKTSLKKLSVSITLAFMHQQ